LIQKADEAMYVAKRRRQSFAFASSGAATAVAAQVPTEN
jgi:hypothetical protein